MDSNGGLKEVNAMVEKFKEGQGKPPCVFAMENGLKVAKPLQFLKQQIVRFV